MKCPHCKKEIKCKKEPRDKFIEWSVIFMFNSMLVSFALAALLSWTKIPLPIGMLFMIAIFIFYGVYGYLYTKDKVKGRLIIIKP